MNKELLLVITSVSNEKDLDQAVIVQALEESLEAATMRKYPNIASVRVVLDSTTGDYTTYRQWEVVEADDFCDSELEKNKEELPDDMDLQAGDLYEEEMPSIPFTRIAANTVKQVIIQKVRIAEREKIAENYQSKVGTLLSGIVKKTMRDSVIVDLGNGAEGILFKSQMIPKESFRLNDRLKALLVNIESNEKGAQLLLSRTDSRVIIELFKLEVPEVSDGIIDICQAAREPGVRSKIAVRTNDGRIDPVGACVGMRGARVQAVSSELMGERVDIILWDDSLAQLIVNAMSPAEVVSIVIDEDSHSMEIAVSEDDLPQAIGRSGQNIRLASELTGWKLNVMSDTMANEKRQKEENLLKKELMDQLDVEEDLVDVLIAEGYSSIDEIAYEPSETLLEIEGFDEELIEELQGRAKKALLVKLMVKNDSNSLQSIEGLNFELIQLLEKNDISDRETLAEQSVYDLCQISEELSEEDAASIIMEARSHWFDEEDEDEDEDEDNESDTN